MLQFMNTNMFLFVKICWPKPVSTTEISGAILFLKVGTHSRVVKSHFTTKAQVKPAESWTSLQGKQPQQQNNTKKARGKRKRLSGKAQPKEQARQVNLSSWARRHLLLTRKLRQQRAAAQRISVLSSTRKVVQKDQMDVPSSTNATC